MHKTVVSKGKTSSVNKRQKVFVHKEGTFLSKMLKTVLTLHVTILYRFLREERSSLKQLHRTVTLKGGKFVSKQTAKNVCA